ncbi:MAG: fibronectin type III domain-containing protein [Bryobacteraceae bacterium]
MSRLAASLITVGLVATGCGSPGDPSPPSLNIPERISDLSAQQVGDRILVRFTLPELTTDGVALRRFRAVELRAGPSPEGNFDTERWAAQARLAPVAADRPGPVEIALPAAEWAGRELILGVRAVGPKGRAGAWSNLVALEVVPPLPRPSGLRAESCPEGVRLSWESGVAPAGARFRVFRRGEAQKQPEPVGETAAPPYVDATAAFGQNWEYAVQAFVKTGQTEALSEISDTVRIKPEDRFPPAPPGGLQATPGLGTIELMWDRNQEPDLHGYRVWRALGDGPLSPLSEIIEVPGYSDRSIESGKKYRYAVSAVDTRGNESAPSSPVEVTAP